MQFTRISYHTCKKVSGCLLLLLLRRHGTPLTHISRLWQIGAVWLLCDELAQSETGAQFLQYFAPKSMRQDGAQHVYVEHLDLALLQQGSGTILTHTNVQAVVISKYL